MPAQVKKKNLTLQLQYCMVCHMGQKLYSVVCQCVLLFGLFALQYVSGETGCSGWCKRAAGAGFHTEGHPGEQD